MQDMILSDRTDVLIRSQFSLWLNCYEMLWLFIIWLAPWAGKMTQIARCDWLPERSGLPAISRKKNFPESHIINHLLTKFARSRWLGIGLVLFCEFMDLDFVSVHKHKKELCQDPAILTSHLVNNPYIHMHSVRQYDYLCSPAINISTRWRVKEMSRSLAVSLA